MKKLLLFILVCVSFLQISFSQDITSKEFVDIGGGIGYAESMHGAFNFGITIFTNKYIAWHPEYNMFYGKSGLLFHEINLKFGPYLKLTDNKNTYVSLSSGLSYMLDNNEPGWETTQPDSSPYSSQTYVYKERFFCIPIQLKLNINVYKKINIGIKTTLNKIITESEEDKGTLLFYTGFAF